MSTNANRKLSIAVVFTLLFALCIPGGKGQGGTRLEPCHPDGLFEVVENSPNNTMTCGASDGSEYERFFRMEWLWYTNGTTEYIASCLDFELCYVRNKRRLFSIAPSPNRTVQLTIDTTNSTLFSRAQSFTNSTISCIADPYRTESTCRTDLVYPAKDSSCSAQFQPSPTMSLVTRCDVPKAYSALQRYSCQVFIAQKAVGSPVDMVTAPLGTDYVSGSCSMTSGLPSVGGDITVMIIPGRINVTASAIRQPSSARVGDTCPQDVDAGSDLGCSCTTDDRGSPPGFLQWQESSSAGLRRANVSRADDGTVFTCHLLWNASVVVSTTYTLRVNWRPSRVTHNCPEYVPEGSDVNCTCFSSDVGKPAGSSRWALTGSEHLSLRQVSLDGQGKRYLCTSTWRGQIADSVSYVLVIPASGDLIRQARSEGQTSGLSTGIGIGVGVGLAVAVISAAALVVVTWRRGWMLPCADATRSVEASNISESSREGDGAANVPENGNEGPRLYEDIRLNEVNVPSTYEDLRPRIKHEASLAPIHKETRRVYDNRAFGSDNDQRGDVPTGKKKPKKTLEKKQSESPVYGNVEHESSEVQTAALSELL